VPDIGKNLRDFQALPLSEEAKQQILSRTALRLWPT
jgi:predicted TIM-barrel fold metal-dependent hydrolase